MIIDDVKEQIKKENSKNNYDDDEKYGSKDKVDDYDKYGNQIYQKK